MATAPSADAQTIASRVNAVRDGHVVFNYETRPDVCGSDDDNFQFRGDFVIRSGRYRNRSGCDCLYGPAWVTLTRTGGQTTGLHMRVGRAPAHVSNDVDLGTVEPDDAVDFLIDVARTIRASGGERALGAAAVANSDRAGPRFLALAESGEGAAPLELRKNALFWAGQSDLALSRIVGAYARLRETELREHYTFVLSQRHEPEATNRLIDVVEQDRDPDVRRQAIFWLGQRNDSSARKFLVDLLMK